MAAMKAAEGGCRTVVLERERLPRFKLCGGGVSGWIVKMLRVPEEVIEREYRFLEYYAPPDYEVLKLPFSVSYYGVCRDKFDRFLLGLAEEAGAVVRDGVRVVDVVVEEGRVGGVVTAEGEKVRGGVVVACDGALSTVARRSGFWEKWFTSRGRDGGSTCPSVWTSKSR